MLLYRRVDYYHRLNEGYEDWVINSFATKSRVQEYIKLTPFSDPVGLNVFFSTTKVRTIKRNIFLHKSRNISMSRFYLQSCLSKQANKVFYLYVSTWEHYHEKSILYKIELYHISSTTYYNHLLVYRV